MDAVAIELIYKFEAVSWSLDFVCRRVIGIIYFRIVVRHYLYHIYHTGCVWKKNVEFANHLNERNWFISRVNSLKSAKMSLVSTSHEFAINTSWKYPFPPHLKPPPAFFIFKYMLLSGKYLCFSDAKTASNLWTLVERTRDISKYHSGFHFYGRKKSP